MAGRAGDLRDLVTVERQAKVRTPAGGTRPEWQGIATRPAKVEPLSGQELAYAQQVEARTSHTVTMRYEPSLRITSADRLRWTDRAGVLRTLGVLNVRDEDERGTWLVLSCTETTGA